MIFAKRTSENPSSRSRQLNVTSARGMAERFSAVISVSACKTRAFASAESRAVYTGGGSGLFMGSRISTS